MLEKFDNKPRIILLIFFIILIIFIFLYQTKRYNYLIIFVIILSLNEIYCALNRFKEGNELYNKALNESRRIGKKLVVIGNPTASFKNKLFGSSYGCGDVCIDLAGCECPNKKNRSPSFEALEKLSNYPNDSVVIFESGTKHMVPGLYEEMVRAGGKRVYSVNLNDMSLIRLFSCLTGSIFL
jgi:hypothetical protein